MEAPVVWRKARESADESDEAKGRVEEVEWLGLDDDGMVVVEQDDLLVRDTHADCMTAPAAVRQNLQGVTSTWDL